MNRNIRVFVLFATFSFVANLCQAQFQDGSQPVLLNLPTDAVSSAEGAGSHRSVGNNVVKGAG